jgi:mannose-6-phosphate isomerase-like protein (cupin superfamily)
LHWLARIATLSRMKIPAMLWMWMLCLASSLSFAQDTKPTTQSKFGPTVEIPADATHQLKTENEYFRAYYVTVGPQQSTLMHHHGYDYVAVALGHTTVDSTSPDGTVKHVALEDGDVRYTPAGVTHVVTNTAAVPFHNATIELLQNHGAPVCVNNCASDPRAKDWPPLPAESKLIGYGDTFRISEVVIKPQQTIATEEGFPHLVVMVSDLHAHSGPAGSGGMDFSQKAGDMMFHGGHPDHGLTNTGDQDIRLVVMEFKPATAPAATK